MSLTRSSESAVSRFSTLAPNLSVAETKMVKAGEACRIRDIDRKELFRLVAQGIQIALFNLGRNPRDKEELRLTVSGICKDLRTHYPSLTADDFSLLMELGSRGEYKTKEDEVVMVTISSVYQWVRLYIRQRRDALAKQTRYEERMEKQEAQISEEEKQRRSLQTVCTMIREEYGDLGREGVRRSLFPARGYRFEIIYDFLVARSHINPNDQLKITSYERAISLFLSYVEREALSVRVRPDYDEIKNRSILAKPRNQKMKNAFHKELTRLSKEIIVTGFLTELKNKGVVIEEILNQDQALTSLHTELLIHPTDKRKNS